MFLVACAGPVVGFDPFPPAPVDVEFLPPPVVVEGSVAFLPPLEVEGLAGSEAPEAMVRDVALPGIVKSMQLS